MPEVNVLSGEEARKKILEGGLNFADATIKGNLWFTNATIKGDIDFTDVTIKGDLDLAGATIEGNLALAGATIKGILDFSTLKGPAKIYVSPDLAQIVHLAAPNVPLAVTKKS